MGGSGWLCLIWARHLLSLPASFMWFIRSDFKQQLLCLFPEPCLLKMVAFLVQLTFHLLVSWTSFCCSYRKERWLVSLKLDPSVVLFCLWMYTCLSRCLSVLPVHLVLLSRQTLKHTLSESCSPKALGGRRVLYTSLPYLHTGARERSGVAGWCDLHLSTQRLWAFHLFLWVCCGHGAMRKAEF